MLTAPFIWMLSSLEEYDQKTSIQAWYPIKKKKMMCHGNTFDVFLMDNSFNFYADYIVVDIDSKRRIEGSENCTFVVLEKYPRWNGHIDTDKPHPVWDGFIKEDTRLPIQKEYTIIAKDLTHEHY